MELEIKIPKKLVEMKCFITYFQTHLLQAISSRLLGEGFSSG